MQTPEVKGLEAYLILAKPRWLHPQCLPKLSQSIPASRFVFQTWPSAYLLFCASSPILFDVFRSRNWELPRYFFLFNGSTVSACHSILQDA